MVLKIEKTRDSVRLQVPNDLCTRNSRDITLSVKKSGNNLGTFNWCFIFLIVKNRSSNEIFLAEIIKLAIF